MIMYIDYITALLGVVSLHLGSVQVSCQQIDVFVLLVIPLSYDPRLRNEDFAETLSSGEHKHLPTLVAPSTQSPACFS